MVNRPLDGCDLIARDLGPVAGPYRLEISKQPPLFVPVEKNAHPLPVLIHDRSITERSHRSILLRSGRNSVQARDDTVRPREKQHGQGQDPERPLRQPG